MPATQEINQVGKREDLSDALVFTNASKTPFVTMVSKGSKPGNTLLEFPIDQYAEPNTDGVVDGADVSMFQDEQEDRALLYARIQKVRRAPKVTDLAQSVSVQAGTPNPIAAAKAKALVELKFDIESVCLSDNESQEDAGSVPYKTRGLGVWLQATAQTDLPVPAAYRTASGQIYSSAIGSLTESLFRGLLQAKWQNTRNSGTLYAFCGSYVKNAITDYTRYEPTVSNYTNVRRFNSARPTTIETTVDIYKGDYDTVIFALDPFLPDNYRAYLLDLSGVSLRFTRAPGTKDLPDLGGGPRALVDAVFALIVNNPTAHIKIAATS